MRDLLYAGLKCRDLELGKSRSGSRTRSGISLNVEPNGVQRDSWPQHSVSQRRCMIMTSTHGTPLQVPYPVLPLTPFSPSSAHIVQFPSKEVAEIAFTP